MRKIILLCLMVLLVVSGTSYARKILMQLPGGEVFSVGKKQLKIDLPSALRIVAKQTEKHIDENKWFMQSIQLINRGDSLAWKVNWQKYNLKAGQSILKQILIDMNGNRTEITDVQTSFIPRGGRVIFVEEEKLKINLLAALKITEQYYEKDIDNDIWFLQCINLIPYSDYFVWEIQWQRYVPKDGQSNFKQTLIDMDEKIIPWI